MLKKIAKNKRIIISIMLLCVCCGLFLFFSSVSAQNDVTSTETRSWWTNMLDGIENFPENFVIALFTKIADIATWFLGVFLLVIAWAIGHVAGYNGFIDEPTIIEAWTIIRDLCNMLFVLILLIIAFASILRIESYNMKKWLPKLIIMAILINFSRTICGLIIDFSQVIMLTFINVLGNTGGEWMDALGVKNYLSMIDDRRSWSSDPEFFSTIGGIFVAIVFFIIAIVVLAVILGVLAMRIIFLWIYVVLSPIAFLLSAFPGGQKYASQWWSEFTKQVVTGPVLAFFIWLALISANAVSLGDVGERNCFGPGEIACTDNFINFIIAIGMLIGGLTITSQLGGTAGNLAGKGMAWAKKGAMVAALPAIGAGKGAKAFSSFLVDKTHQKTGIDLNLPRAWKTLKATREDNRQRRYAEGVSKAGQVMAEGGRWHGLAAMTGSPGDAWNQITKGGLMERIRGGEKNKKERDKIEPGLKLAKFKEEYSTKSGAERTKTLNDLTRQSYEIDNSISDIESDTDMEDKVKKDKIEALKKQKQSILRNLDFATANDRDFSDSERKTFVEEVKVKQAKMDKYVPAYSFEARSAEEKAVAGEAEKIKKIDDAQELVRMLKEAIKGGEKSRIKAIMKKLTADYNDNEAFQAIVPDAGSGYEGLQALMDGLSDENNKDLYAGFTKQEAYTLGAQVAEMNKKTNHWEAAGAYKMENGQWEKMNAQEHAEYASTEFGKKGPRANAKEFNRLAMGKHVRDPKTGKMEFKLTDTGLLALKSWDNVTGIDRMLEDMTESTAKYLEPFLDDLEKKGFFEGMSSKPLDLSDGKGLVHHNLADMIRTKAGKAAGGFEKQYEYIKKNS